MLVREYKGKKADRLVTRIDPGVVSLVAELRAHERRPAEELEPWKTHHEERKPPMPTGSSRSFRGKRFGRRLTDRSR